MGHPMSRLQGVIFDIDGTLVDSNDLHARAWHDAFRKAGREIEFDRIRRLIGVGSDKLFAELTGQSLDSPDGKTISGDCKRIFAERYLPQVRPFAKGRELVERLEVGRLRLAVATSARREDLEALLKIAGVPQLLDSSTTSNETDRSKPDPDVVTAALRRLDLPAQATLMIGDTPYDVEAGNRAGVGVIALRCGGWSDRELAGAVAIYDSPADLLDHYDESPLGQAM